LTTLEPCQILRPVTGEAAPHGHKAVRSDATSNFPKETGLASFRKPLYALAAASPGICSPMETNLR